MTPIQASAVLRCCDANAMLTCAACLTCFSLRLNTPTLWAANQIRCQSRIGWPAIVARVDARCQPHLNTAPSHHPRILVEIVGISSPYFYPPTTPQYRQPSNHIPAP
jgi:hypothetical protein